MLSILIAIVLSSIVAFGAIALYTIRREEAEMDAMREKMNTVLCYD